MNGEDSVMVLVTLQRHCARLIRRGADMALKRGCALKVVHVAEVRDREAQSSAIHAEILNDLYALANEAGAEMCVLTSEVAVNAMAEYAKEHGVKQVVMGNGERAHGIGETLSALLPGVAIAILDQ